MGGIIRGTGGAVKGESPPARLLRISFLPRLLKKVQMQGGALKAE